MANIGLKIVDRDAQAIAPLVDYSLQTQRPLEIGWYHGNPAARRLLRAQLTSTTPQINCHVDQKLVGVLEAQTQQANLIEHIELAQAHGARYSIIHTGRGPMSARQSRRPQLFDELFRQLEAIETLCERFDYAMYIENTFHHLDFYQAWFQKIQQQGFKRIHFCFDIGHANVWSSQPLTEWLEFLQTLQSQSFNLHFHWHVNDGLADQHLSLLEAEARGLLAGDDDYLPMGWLTALKLIERDFPASHKVFEVKSDQAIANLEWALTWLGSTK